MARPHIMFIQAQDLPWQKGLYGPGRDDVEMKVLSMDDAGTDATTILRYPAGWARPTPEYCTAHEEFLVLEGALVIDGQTYDRHCYGFFPAGYTRGTASSPTGAVVLTMFADKPMIVNGTGKAYDESLLVKCVDPKTMEWTPAEDPPKPRGASLKWLRTDPNNNAASFLYAAPPHYIPADMAKPKWTHGVAAEMFVIDGEYDWSDVGRMGPGAYTWWRENAYHGPSGSDVGFLIFVRTIDGPLLNVVAEDQTPFTWDTPYNPQLPDNLKKVAKGYIRPVNY